jgi:monoamine oxidase
VHTVIVGAGLAGLAAAQRLVCAGHLVNIVEARDRIGGRVWTATDGTSDLPVELGAEWIASAGAARDLLLHHDVRLAEARGSRWRKVAGQWKNARHLPDLTDELVKRARSATRAHG